MANISNLDSKDGSQELDPTELEAVRGGVVLIPRPDVPPRRPVAPNKNRITITLPDGRIVTVPLFPIRVF